VAGAPSSLASGELAFNEISGTLYYGAGSSGGLATSIIPIVKPDAPSDGQVYGRVNGAWGVVPVRPDAPLDGAMYGRISGAWGRAVNVAGDNMTGNLNVAGNVGFNTASGGSVNMAGNLTVGGGSSLGSANLNSTLTVAGATTLNSSLAVGTAAHLYSSLIVDGTTNLNSNLAVGGTTTLNALTVNGAANLSATNLTVGGTTTLNALTVNGTTTLNSSLAVGGNVIGDLPVTGEVFCYRFNCDTNVSCNSLNVLGAATLAALTVNNANAYKIGGGSWASVSDSRIKNIHKNYDSGLAQIEKLQPVVYSYKGNDAAPGGASPHDSVANSGKEFIGLIAQECETLLPEMVTRSAGFIDSAPVSDLRSLDAGPLLYVMLNAIKELSRRLQAAEAKLEGLA